MKGYEDNKLATPAPSRESRIQGVRAAVDNFQVQMGYFAWKIFHQPPRLVAHPDNAVFLDWASRFLVSQWPEIQQRLATYAFGGRAMCLLLGDPASKIDSLPLIQEYLHHRAPALREKEK